MPKTSHLQEEINKIESLMISLQEALVDAPNDVLERALIPLRDKRETLLSYLAGSGATAQNHSLAVGMQGVSVRGNVAGDIITGIKAENLEITYPSLEKSLQFPEALSKYLENIIATHQHLRLQGIRTGSQPVSVPLEKVYVSLSAIEGKQDERNGEHDYSEKEYLHAQGNYMSIGTALNRFRRLVVIGDPGCGKTTLISYLGLTYARTLAERHDYIQERLSLHEAQALPIILPLRELGYHLQEKHANPGKDGPSILLDYLREYYAAQRILLPEDFFSQYLESGNAILLLDGMDEVADSTLRQRVARLIEKFTFRFEKNRFLVTSREIGYEGVSRIGANFGLAKIRKFLLHEIRQFVKDWTRAIETTLANTESEEVLQLADDEAQKLIKAIESNARVMDLAVNPLLLTVIALVHRYRAQLPERRSELYEEAVEVLLGYWDEAKGLVINTSIAGRELDTGDRRSLLEPIAFWMHEQRKREIERDMLVSLLIPAFQAMTPDLISATKAVSAFINTINIRSGLMVERGIGIYGFAHLTFQEYLAARALADHKNVLEYTRMHLSDAWWREVILLVAGYLSTQGKRRVSEFIRAIMEEKEGDDSEPFHNLLLATECLFDVGPARVEGDLLGEVRAQLKKQSGAPLIKGDRKAVITKVLAANALARIESGNVQSHFWKLPYGEPDWAKIPAGKFRMGSGKIVDEKPIHELFIPDFQIARVPVTNSQYALFIKDSNAKPPYYWHGQQVPAGLENHPVVAVSWYEALEYCRWLSKNLNQTITLPSETEWEKAARGGSDLRSFPWGKWSELHCNIESLGTNDTVPVGLFLNGQSPYGILDMSGNVWEWTRSIYREYPYNSLDGREVLDPSFNGINSIEPRVLRGGSFRDGIGGVRCSYRFWDLPGAKHRHYGFRIVSYEAQR